jgi:hypothetical protein
MQTKEFSPDSSGHVAGVAGRQAATIEEHLPGPFSNVTEIWSLLKNGPPVKQGCGYVFNWVCGSGSGSVFGIRIRIQEGKNDPQK